MPTDATEEESAEFKQVHEFDVYLEVRDRVVDACETVLVPEKSEEMARDKAERVADGRVRSVTGSEYIGTTQAQVVEEWRYRFKTTDEDTTDDWQSSEPHRSEDAARAALSRHTDGLPEGYLSETDVVSTKRVISSAAEGNA